MENKRVGRRFFLYQFNGSSNAVIQVESVVPSYPPRVIGTILDTDTGCMTHTGFQIENLPLLSSLGGELTREEDHHFRLILEDRLRMFFLYSVIS